jgi:hypothetical protein
MAAPSLRDLRDALLAVHRELLQAQRADHERLYGRMTESELLQAVVTDLRFDWLRPLSRLATDIDALLADPERRDEPVAAAELVDRARGLLAPPDPGAPFGGRYLRALQDEPGVGVAHGRLAALLR